MLGSTLRALTAANASSLPELLELHYRSFSTQAYLGTILKRVTAVKIGLALRASAATGAAAADGAPMPALIVSASAERFRRAAQRMASLGFAAERVHAVFVEPTKGCQGTNGHRLAMHAAWKVIVRRNISMAVFEDDAVPASLGRLNGSRPLASSPAATVALALQIRAYIRANAPSHDVLWLGGLGQLGACDKNLMANSGVQCMKTSLPYDRKVHPKVFGSQSGSVRATGRIPAHATYYTDHAKWISPRGARILLACTERCLENPGWGVDSIQKFICADARRAHSEKRTEYVHNARRTLCKDTTWVRARSKQQGNELRCLGPPAELWRVMRDDVSSTLDPRTKVFLGFFWQDRTNGSLLMTQRSAFQLRAYDNEHLSAEPELNFTVDASNRSGTDQSV